MAYDKSKHVDKMCVCPCRSLLLRESLLVCLTFLFLFRSVCPFFFVNGGPPKIGKMGGCFDVALPTSSV